MNLLRILALPTALAAATLLAACTSLAPGHRTPAPPVPARITPALEFAASADAPTLGAAPDTAWVQEPRLRALLAQALAENRDLRLALLAVERARAQAGIAEADRLPALAASGGATRSRTADDLKATPTRPNVGGQYSAQIGFASYEIDFWGRVKNLNEAALQEFLRVQENQAAARIALGAELVQAWLVLDADARRLQLARQTLASRSRQLELTQRSHALGAASALTLAQVQTLVAGAREAAAAAQTQVARGRHALALLAGAPVADALLPESVAAGAPELAPVLALAELPAGLPSTALLARPDVRAAEHALAAADAHIGVARAAFFPTIALTASAGTASNQLSGLFAGGNQTWSFAPQIRLPLFDGGRNRANLRIAELAQQSALAQYEKILQQAFREVADALAERATLGERLQAQEDLVQASARAHTLSRERYRLGADSYLAVLDAERSLYGAQQGLIALRLSAQTNRVLLYKALGGAAAQ